MVNNANTSAKRTITLELSPQLKTHKQLRHMTLVIQVCMYVCTKHIFVRLNAYSK